MTFTAQQSRVDALVGLLGMFVLGLGAALIYFTNSNATVAGIAPAIITINYALGLLLLVVGLLAAFAKFK